MKTAASTQSVITGARVPALGALVALACASCSPADRFIDAQIDYQLGRGDPPTLDLGQVGPAQWTRVCAFGPRATDAQARERLGFDWELERHTGLATADDRVALVFSDGRRVLAFVERARGAGDFTSLEPACLGREAARLVGRRDATGALRFETATAPAG